MKKHISQTERRFLELQYNRFNKELIPRIQELVAWVQQCCAPEGTHCPFAEGRFVGTFRGEEIERAIYELIRDAAMREPDSKGDDFEDSLCTPFFAHQLDRYIKEHTPTMMSVDLGPHRKVRRTRKLACIILGHKPVDIKHNQGSAIKDATCGRCGVGLELTYDMTYGETYVHAVKK